MRAAVGRPTDDATGLADRGAIEVWRRRGRRRLVAVALLLALVVASAAVAVGRARADTEARTGVLVVRADAADRWERLLRANGVPATTADLASLDAFGAVVVPAAATLREPDVARLRAFVERGGHVATPHTELLAALGFALGDPRPAAQLLDDLVAAPIRVPAALLVRPLGWSGTGPVKVRARADAEPLVAQATLGDGVVLGLGVDPVGEGRLGYEVVPGLAQHVGEALGVGEGPRRGGVEVYFDPGVARTVYGPLGVDELAARLGSARIVHVAGWNLGFTDPADDFDYAGFIAALHRRGVLAYAWLEPPHVSQWFWEYYPQCRQRLEDGTSRVVDWRLLIAIEDPSCFDNAWLEVWEPLLTRFDWDGVNVAELYFDDIAGARVPYSAAALARFGHDPAADPEGFLDFRTHLATELTAKMLGQAQRFVTGGRELVLTLIDEKLAPDLARRVGSDVAALSAVATQAGATVQIEDPYPAWSRGPLRYDDLIADPGVVAGTRAYADINVVDRTALGGSWPTATLTGGELFLAAQAASARSGRVAIYTFGTIDETDLARLPLALGAVARATDGRVDAPFAVEVRTPDPARDALWVDGVRWPAWQGRAVVPAGRHRLEWRAGGDDVRSLVRFSGELASARTSSRSLDLRYDSVGRALAVVDARPDRVRVDGREVAVDVVQGADGWVLALPAGTHRASVTFAVGA